MRIATAMTDLASGKYVSGDISFGAPRKRSMFPMAMQSMPSSAALALTISDVSFISHPGFRPC